MVKNGYYGNGGLRFAWDLGIIFLGIPNHAIDGFLKKILFNFGLKSVLEKRMVCFLVYLFLSAFD